MSSWASKSIGGGVLRRNEASRLQDLMDASGLHLNAQTLAVDLPIADQQKVEILRALAREAQVIVMDEPTSSLSKDEIDQLHKIMGLLRDEGRTIVYVTHFLDHVLEVCDQVTVLRDGNLVMTEAIADQTKQSLVGAMLGGDRTETYYPAKSENPDADIVLSVRNLVGVDVNVMALDIMAGEIVGLIGLVGSGRSEIARAIVGADKVTGVITLNGKNHRAVDPERDRGRDGYGARRSPKTRAGDGTAGQCQCDVAAFAPLLTHQCHFGKARMRCDRQAYPKVQCSPGHDQRGRLSLFRGQSAKGPSGQMVRGRPASRDPRRTYTRCGCRRPRDDPRRNCRVGCKWDSNFAYLVRDR